MSACIRTAVVDSPESDSSAVPVSAANNEPFANESSTSLVLSASPSTIACPVEGGIPDLAAYPADAADVTNVVLTIPPGVLPSAPVSDERSALSSPVPIPISSEEALPSGLPAPIDDNASSVSSDEDCPACAGHVAAESADYPVDSSVPVLRLHGPSPGPMSGARSLSSIGVQTHVMLTKRGERIPCMHHRV